MVTLILAGRKDPEARRAATEVRALGGHVLRCDTAAFPERVLLSIRDGELRFGRRVFPLPKTLYLRGLGAHPLTSEFQKDLDTRPRGLIAQCEEKRAMLVSLVLTLQRRGVRIVNDLDANAQHSYKPYQLELLRSHGLPVPHWLATNDPKAVRKFVRHVGQAVYKPLSGGATVRLVEEDDLSDERLSALSLAPVLFQELVDGVSVRAYVVHRRVVAAAEIHSPEVDYRRDEHDVTPTQLRADEKHAVVAAAWACGMAFCGVDLIRHPGGLKIIECNPSPMFYVFEHKTGVNIAGPLARLLVGKRA